MALIKCPECGKEVSDKAETCVNCGFSIKQFFEEQAKFKSEEIEREKKQKQKQEEINRRMEYIVPPQHAPFVNAYIIIGIMFIVIAITSFVIIAGNGYVDTLGVELIFMGIIFVLIGILAIVLGINRLKKERATFYKYRDNENEYKKVIATEAVESEIKMKEMSEKRKEEKKVILKCPTCGSTNVVRISAGEKVTNAAMFGLFGNKRKKQFHCKDCKYYW